MLKGENFTPTCISLITPLTVIINREKKFIREFCVLPFTAGLLVEKFPGIFPASVVTRSMKAKKEAIKEQVKEEICLSGTFLENIDGKFEERNKEKAEKALMRNESRNVKGNIPGKQEGESKSVISRQNLIEEQSNDKELLDLFKIALTPVEDEKVSVGYLIKDNILKRK